MLKDTICCTPTRRNTLCVDCNSETMESLWQLLDYVETLPDSISKWLPKRLFTLGTDGFWTKEGRNELVISFSEMPAIIVTATLYAFLYKDGK